MTCIRSAPVSPPGIVTACNSVVFACTAFHTGAMRTVLLPAAHSRDRDVAWRATISRTFGGVASQPAESPDDRNRLVIAGVGRLRVLESRTCPGDSSKGRVQGDDERVALFLQAGGETVAEQNGRSDRYRNGDLGL